jgi:hypothetical protein
VKRIACLFLTVHWMAAAAGAQSAEPAGPLARLREYEATYQAGLRKIQTPLLTDYAQKLQQLLGAAPPEDQPAIRLEIARVQTLIATGGLVDLRSASATQPREPGPGPGPASGPGMRPPPGAVLVLRPDTAIGATVAGTALTIGKASWKVAHLDAGTYEVTVVCSFPSFNGTGRITASLAGEEASGEVNSSKSARTPDQFRLMKLGRIRFERDLKDEELKLELKAAELPGVQIRQVLIVKPRQPGK